MCLRETRADNDPDLGTLEGQISYRLCGLACLALGGCLIRRLGFQWKGPFRGISSTSPNDRSALSHSLKGQSRGGRRSVSVLSSSSRPQLIAQPGVTPNKAGISSLAEVGRWGSRSAPLLDSPSPPGARSVPTQTRRKNKTRFCFRLGRKYERVHSNPARAGPFCNHLSSHH